MANGYNSNKVHPRFGWLALYGPLFAACAVGAALTGHLPDWGIGLLWLGILVSSPLLLTLGSVLYARRQRAEEARRCALINPSQPPGQRTEPPGT